MSKFRFISGFMLIGILLTSISCVNDSESESVKDLRDAKTQLILAQTARENALARQQEVIAEISEALKEAQIAYEEALLQGNTEQAKTDLAIAQAEAEYKLADAKAKAESAMLAALTALENAKLQALKDHDNLLLGIIDDYTKKIIEIQQKQAAIATLEIDIKKAETAYEVGKNSNSFDVASYIIGKENDKRKEEDVLKEHERLLANLEELAKSASDIEKAIEDATTALKTIDGKKAAAYQTYQLKYATYNRLASEFSDWLTSVNSKSKEELQVELQRTNANLNLIKKEKTDSIASLDKLKSGLQKLEDDYSKAKADRSKAEDDYNKLDAADPGKADAYNKWQEALTAEYEAKLAYDNQVTRIDSLTGMVDSFSGYITSLELAIADLNDAIANYGDKSSKQQELKEGVENANKERLTAYSEYDKIDKERTIEADFLAELKLIYNGQITVLDAIADKKQDIESTKKSIAQIEADIKNATLYKSEGVLENLKQEVERNKTKLETLKIELDHLKKEEAILKARIEQF